MKFSRKLLPLFLVFLFMFSAVIIGQEEKEKEEFKSVYLTVTTTHWSDDPEADFSDWLDTEKEYHEKVTMKNDLIIGSGVYTHYMTADNSEVVLVNVYKSWEDIEKANDVNSKLAKEAWPDEEKRKAFFDKQRSYYSADHRDEIYSSMPFSMPMELPKDKSLIFYVRKSDLAMDGKGSSKNFKEFFEKVTKKNAAINAYYSHRHLWGSNSREFSEVFVVENLGDIEKIFDENKKLIEEAWPEEEARKSFFKEMNKLFTGKHGDFIYKNVPELVK